MASWTIYADAIIELEKQLQESGLMLPASEVRVEAFPTKNCDFCGMPNGCHTHPMSLRCQEKPWLICGRIGCYESVSYHEERIAAGLVDCAETRAATRAWVMAKTEREKRERGR